MKKNTQTKSKRDRFAYNLFWSWNLIFLAFMTLGFAPRILPDMILAIGTSTIPASFLLYGLVLTAVPIVSVILGLTVLKGSPGRLFAFGYVVEWPLMFVLAVRFFIIREATSVLTLILIITGIGMGAFLWYLLDPEIERRSTLMGWLRLAGLTLMVLASLYAALWIVFYALPIVVWALQYVGEILTDLPRFLEGFWRVLVDLFTGGLVWVPFAFLGFILLYYTGTLFVLTPLAVPYLSLRAWWRTLSSLEGRQGWGRPTLIAALTAVGCTVIFVGLNRQPQQQAFALLDSPPATVEEARTLLKKQDEIRTGLLNAYLAPFRYISAVGEVAHIRSLYRNVFNMSEVEAASVQRFYEFVVSPLLYNPVHAPKGQVRNWDNVALQQEPQEAAELYQQFFDQPIVEGERQTIVRAVRSTWSLTEAEAAWQAVDDREVLLLQQEVNVTEHGDWAEVELYEVYQNQTAERQEVIYYFNLPESAVLTGVWLGNSPDRESRFVYQVAPRGAAQAVYRNETRQNRDPALLEQIGPRQYRLRIFPVPPVRTDWDEERSHVTVEEALPLYMWMTYAALPEQNTWPLPQLAVKRNVYWNGETTRLVNGAPMKTDDDTWIPNSVPASATITPRIHRVDLPGGESVVATPLSQVSLPALPADLHLAAVIDRSLSMAVHHEGVTIALEQLQEAVGPGASVDVYLTSSPYRGEPPSRRSLKGLDPKEITYFGGQNAAELLAQFEALRAGRVYDAVMVFTDGSGYELGETGVVVPTLTAPVWMVHLDSDIPLGYDDDTLEAIQASGGGVVGELDQALTRLGVALAREVSGGDEGGRRDILDGYLWTMQPATQAGLDAEGGSPDQDFTPFAARYLILAEMQRHQGGLDQLDTLDYLHFLAQEYGIVTPYSSMIVLVTPGQEALLRRLSQGQDRFDREFEDLSDTTPSTPRPLRGVPEPHEWLLIGLAVAMLIWYAGRERFAFQRR